jgi:hypothetical protein
MQMNDVFAAVVFDIVVGVVEKYLVPVPNPTWRPSLVVRELTGGLNGVVGLVLSETNYLLLIPRNNTILIEGRYTKAIKTSQCPARKKINQ